MPKWAVNKTHHPSKFCGEGVLSTSVAPKHSIKVQVQFSKVGQTHYTGNARVYSPEHHTPTSAG